MSPPCRGVLTSLLASLAAGHPSENRVPDPRWEGVDTGRSVVDMDTATIQRTAVETPRPGLAPAIALRSVATTVRADAGRLEALVRDGLVPERLDIGGIAEEMHLIAGELEECAGRLAAP